MKDWKAECERLRGELKESRQRLAQIDYEKKQQDERDYVRREEARRFFRELMLDVLGR